MKTLIIALFSLILLPSGVYAQSSDDDELQLYDVEIIIFKNNQGPKGDELNLPVSSPRYEGELVDLSSPESIKAAEEKLYTVLAPDQLRMLDKVQNIVDSPYFDLLAHIGWRQPGVEKEQAIPIWIRGGRIYGAEYVSIDSQLAALPFSDQTQFNGNGLANSQSSGIRGTRERLYELEGKITVALSRYLHFYSDLVLRRPRVILDQALENPEFATAAALDNTADTHILNNHSLREQRRMRSKTLHYLDNPEFSLLVLITPYEAEELADPAAQPVNQ